VLRFAPLDPAVDWKWNINSQSESYKKWFLMATQRAKWSTPSERALKTELKTGVRLFVAFCLTQFVP